ncbi:glucosaminidase domain-containing protein [Allomesorhizobium alhagi]|uniref:Mannosyl-glycoprotein endo-beta-N-acetylglucosamidase-like domain-containing protein n=1 Tax=Mesorhizobium alhagi CCNWXJ12-2 TaxID=1107882 RepID=H0I413_9HYPH|nr:glucosaminidase domain-containing protein [Mesorhizobium alhagi]EHK52275.1 hypothetical protein MAXJ12_36161 [Mesorhizobium alhagi CCNWXJ12-2]
MVKIDQSGLAGKIRDRPISKELEAVLQKAGLASGVDVVLVTSGGQPGSSGRSKGSTRHNGGRAADLQLMVKGKAQTFTDDRPSPTIAKFIIAAAAYGATGIGAGVNYMGRATLHVGFGLNPNDRSKLTWGAKGRSVNAPLWLKKAADEGWNSPPGWVFDNDDGFVEDEPEDGEDEFEEEEDVEVFLEIPERFNIEVIRAAQASQRVWSIPASITLAQWALESAYGTRMPAGSNNPFGIKAKSGQPSVMALTTEVIGGKKKTVNAAFRAFSSLEEAFIRHGKLLGSADVYASARRFVNDPDRFADALTGVYATDPKYGRLLKSIMKKNDLYRFDILVDDEGMPVIVQGEVGVVEPLQQGGTIRVEALQRRLVELGYLLGEIDGKFGPLTASALLSFQHENSLPTTGVLDTTTEEALNTAEPRRLSEKRVKKTEKELAEDGSKITINARRGRLLSWVGGILGAVGIGNSAIINATGSASIPTGTASDALVNFITQVKTLSASSTQANVEQVLASALSIAQQVAQNPLPANVLQLLDRVRQTIPEGVPSRPIIDQAFQTITQTSPVLPAGSTTVFDILPTFFANDTVLQTVMKGVAAVGGSVLPGFGGSLAMLGIGLAGRFLSNRIAAARLEDHKTGGNINPLGK